MSVKVIIWCLRWPISEKFRFFVFHCRIFLYEPSFVMKDGQVDTCRHWWWGELGPAWIGQGKAYFDIPENPPGGKEPFVPQMCPHWGVVGKRPGLDKGVPSGLRHFPCKFLHKMALVRHVAGSRKVCPATLERGIFPVNCLWLVHVRFDCAGSNKVSKCASRLWGTAFFLQIFA